VDRRTWEELPVELFVAVLGASSLTYAEAVESQKLDDWVGAHTRMAEYFGGSTNLWVPDRDQLQKRHPLILTWELRRVDRARAAEVSFHSNVGGAGELARAGGT